MKIKNINILGHNLTVEEQKEATCEDNGLTDLWGQAIYINDGLTDTLKEMTLCHEIIHHFIRLSGTNFFFKGDDEEKLAKLLQVVFWRFLKDNTDFFKSYKYCNHHHEPTKEHKIIEIDGQKIVANELAVTLLKELNKLGLKTRSHHIDGDINWVTILLDNVNIEIKDVDEKDATRTKYNGKKELLISWNNKAKTKEGKG